MLLSVIIPVYNVENYIQKCLDSIIELPLPIEKYEIIVVNDGSNDNSIEVVSEYQKRCENLRVISQTNKGPGAARNLGLQHATGEWVYFIDSDDYIDARLFTKLLATSCYDHEVDIIIGDFLYVKDSLLCKSKYMIHTTHDLSLSGSVFLKKYFYKIDVMVWRSIYRRKFLLDNNLFFIEGVYHEDVTWTPQCLASARSIHYSPIPFYYYILRANSIMQSSKTQKKLNDRLIVTQDLLMHALKLDKETQKIISYYIFKSILVLVGEYRLFDNKNLYDRINSILSIPTEHNFSHKAMYFAFRAFPWIMNHLLTIRYGRNKRVTSF